MTWHLCHSVAVAVTPALLADAIVTVLRAAGIPEVVDLARRAPARRFDAVVVTGGAVPVDAPIVVRLPEDGGTEVVVTCAGTTETVTAALPGGIPAILEQWCRRAHAT